MGGRQGFGFALAWIASAACGGAPVDEKSLPDDLPIAPAKPPTVAAPGPHDCPVVLEGRELLRRHGAAFGTPAALAATLPRVLRGELETAGKIGKSELALDRARHAIEASVGGVWTASGVDAEGAWEIGAPGVLVRLRPDEAASVVTPAWLARREYVNALQPSRDEVACTLEGGRARATLRFHLPNLGDPELVFDVESAELVRASAASADGRRSTTEYLGWSDAEEGIRFPTATKTTHPAAEPEAERLVEKARGATCKGVDDKRPARADCFTPPPPRLVFGWPAAPILRPAMRYYLGELSVRATLGSRELFALLDSGAGLTILDATTPAAQGFTPTIELGGSGSSQKIKAGLGEVEAITFGGLKLSHVPVASVPVPALDVYGPRRPEVILGYSLFAGAAVRVDYARQILELARAAETLVRPGAVAVPFKVWDDKWIVDVDLDGVLAPLEVDTGDTGGIDLVKSWADAHGFPGARPTATRVAKTGAGAGPTSARLFRLASAKLGPIEFSDRLVGIDDPPSRGKVAGLVGNELFARCSAVTFDLKKRTLWFEPPCDRVEAELLANWQLTRDDADKKSPWVIESVLPGSSAAEAGLAAGDRLLSVGGIIAGPDLASVFAGVRRPPGTVVEVVVQRGSEKKIVSMPLKKLLAR